VADHMIDARSQTGTRLRMTDLGYEVTGVVVGSAVILAPASSPPLGPKNAQASRRPAVPWAPPMVCAAPSCGAVEARKDRWGLQGPASVALVPSFALVCIEANDANTNPPPN